MEVMQRRRAFSLFLQRFTLAFLAFFLFMGFGQSVEANKHKVYIVYRGHHNGLKTVDEIRKVHHSLLLSVKESEEEARSSLIYSYKHSIDGFAALLTPDEATRLSEIEDVVSTFPSQARSMHTTRSWNFLAGEESFSDVDADHEWTSSSLLKEARDGEDIIVGLLDSGIWPESKSFNDEGMKPIPKRWKGICQEGDAFNSSQCNRKLIGARYYLKAYEAQYGKLNTTSEYRSPRDHDGHGTHTASTVGGRAVHNISALGGFAHGSASGGVPLVRLAMYKVCWPIPGGDLALENTCTEADMLAAMDDAIGDGVDVFSISIGTTGDQPSYASDGIAIGSLHALKHNIVVACSAGNSGPKPATASNLAPWIITVAASSIDRSFESPVVLGNGSEVQGQTVTPYKLEDRFYPLVYAGDVSIPGTPKNITGGQCLTGSLDPSKVKGKIVFCLRGKEARVSKGLEVRRAGGAAVILGNIKLNGAEISVDAYVLPGTAVVYKDTKAILKYIKSSKNPVAKIMPAKTILDVKPAPVMAAFSSVGPNSVEPNILKPDITAPGLNILAAWSESSPPTKLPSDRRRVKYNIISGTSMSCPHVAAVAALLKAMHPQWSSAAVRSAIMTTAKSTNNLGLPLTSTGSAGNANPFNYGSGHLNPMDAADPGLVYDASYEDYLLFLCSSGAQIDSSFKCPVKSPRPYELNYPSVAISALNETTIVTRTVTNVGITGKVTYNASVIPPSGVSVKIHPRKLHFRAVGEKRSFTVTFKVTGHGRSSGMKKGDYVFGSYTWSDGTHRVRSPIVASLA
ncbi:subtilisin-like protease SBT5.6 [Nymphaea colorata]|nr:subtilisin-like protease SBT5.6 [Nymphaea colorata]